MAPSPQPDLRPRTTGRTNAWLDAGQRAADRDAGTDTDIDGAALRRQVQRFRERATERLAQAQASLAPTSRLVLEALPYLLHINSPSLPGYAGSSSPAGICDYRPHPNTIKAARQLAPGHRATEQPAGDPAILGVYFMGSAGTIAQTRSSDLDIWVCVDRRHHAAIQPKLEALTDWADTLQVELQAFAVDPAQFASGNDISSSPLLLDEFYRSACLIAGCYPLWWLVPPGASAAEHKALASRLRRERHLHTQNAIDFGPVPEFTAADLHLAATRELENSLLTPYKSLLKLALLETYVGGAAPLSTTYKGHVHRGVDADALDVYLMLADHLDQHFTGGAHDARWQFLRRAWLIKTARGNTRLNAHTPWRQRARAWGYTHPDIEHLRWPQAWSLRELLDESRIVTRQLEHAATFVKVLGETAAAQAPRNAAAEYIAALAAEPDSLLPALVPRKHRSLARIDRQRQPSGLESWCLSDDGRKVVERKHLTEVMCWLDDQGFSAASLSPHCAAQPAVRQLHDALLAAERLLVINAEIDHVTPWDVDGDALITPSDDPLSYSAQRFCLVHTCELIEPGGQGPTVFLADVPDVLARATDVPGLKVACIGDIRRGRIQTRVRSLIDDARAALAPVGAGFAFQLGRDLCVFARRDADAPTQVIRVRSVWEAVHALPDLHHLHSADDAHLDRAYATLLGLRCLSGPSLWLSPGERLVRVLYRAPGQRCLWRFVDHGDGFAAQALGHFLTQHELHAAEPTPVLELARHGPVRLADPGACDTSDPRSLTLRRHRDGWQATLGVDTWFKPRLTRGTLRQLALASDGPLYVTELTIPGLGLPQLLATKARLETLLTRLRTRG